ncbi:hypothetical protein [Streptosporangium longisporum]|uniref:DUF998 domain-containing protein n=1 Tax=Streptosporangium longisporum TaxID=46187 RepID=A0ABN3XZI1_9ACTN
MSESSGRALLARGAVIGLVVGVVAAVLWTDDVTGRGGPAGFVVGAFRPHETASPKGPGGVVNGIAIIVVPVLLGGILARSAGVLRWRLVALGGSVAFGVLTWALFKLAPFHRDAYGLPESFFGIIFLLAGVAGYATAAWMVVPRAALLRILLAGAMIVFSAGAAQVSDRVRHWHGVWDLETMGVPLVLLDVPVLGHVVRPWRLDPRGGPAVEIVHRLRTSRTVVHRFHTPEIDRRRAEGEARVLISATAATPGQACAARYRRAPGYLKAVPASGLGDICRPLPGGRVLWVVDDRPVALFARYGEALLQVSSLVLTEAELLAATDKARPTTARELLGRMAGRPH